MTDVLVEGLTKRSPVGEMSVTFEATGAATNAGIPYIRAVKDNGIAVISAKDTDDKLFTYVIDSRSGAVSKKSKLTDNKYKRSIFVDVADTYSLGPWGKKGFIFAQNLNDYADSGNVIVYGKKTQTTTTYTYPIKEFPSGHKVLGIVVNTRHTYIMVITTLTDDDPRDELSYTGCEFFIFDPKGNLYDSGTVDGSISINTFGLGRSAVWGATASVLEVDEQYVWTADGSGTTPVNLWSYETGVLTLVSTADSGFGISDSAYSATKPSVAVRNGHLIIVAGEIVYRYRRVTVGSAFGYDGSKTWIMEIIKTECALTGALDGVTFVYTGAISDNPNGEISFSAGVDSQAVQGFMTTGGSVRDNIDSLRAMGFFDPMIRGYGFRFRNRDSNSVATIPWGHLGTVANSNTSLDGLVYSLKHENKLPKVFEFTFQDLFRNYDENTVRSEVETIAAQGKEAITFPGVLTKGDAKNIIEIIKTMRYTEKTGYASVLPQIYSYLEVGDAVTLQLEFESGYIEVLARILTLNNKMDGTIAFTAVSLGDATYDGFTPETLPAVDEEEPPTAENSITLYLDVPVLNIVMQNNDSIIMCAAPTSDTWGGNSVFISLDDGETYNHLLEIRYQSVIGTIAETSTAMDCELIDRGTELTLTVVSGELVSITESDLFLGKNLAAWGNETDGWEIFQFQNAVLNMDGTYTLSVLLRGLYGTERITAHNANDTFVLLDGSGEVSTLPDGLFEVDTLLKSLNIGETLDEGDEMDFNYQAVNLKPWSCVKATATRGVPSANDITLDWVRRARYSNSWRSNVEIPLAESSESYEIDVMNGATVVRTLTSTSPTKVYTAAQQVTDFGSHQNPCTFRIYQMSAAVGRGFVYEVTL